MASCNQSVSLEVTYGQNITAQLTLTRVTQSDPNVTNATLENANLTFTYGPNYDTPIQTIPTTQINKDLNTESKLVVSFLLDKDLITDPETGVPNTGANLVFQLDVTTTDPAYATYTGQFELKKGFTSEGEIVDTPNPDETFYLPLGTLDPADFDTDGQVPKWDTAQNKFVAGTDETGGVGGTSDHGSLNGLGDDDHPQYALADGSRGSFATAAQGTTADSAVQPARSITAGAGLDGGGDLSADRTLSLDAATQASLAAADSALQAGDAIPQADVTNLATDLAGKQPLDTALTQLSALAVSNGQFIGWSGGILANVSVPGGGDMLKSTYDSNDDGVIDVGAIPDLSGTYQPLDSALTDISALTLVGDRYIGTDGGGNIALLTIPSIPTTTDDIGEGSNLYYTEARFDASLGTAVLSDFPSGIQTSLGLADTALQSADLNGYQLEPSEGAFADGDKTKLDGIEANAEVNNISDVNATDLTDGSDTTLHTHDGRYYTETETNALLDAVVEPLALFSFNGSLGSVGFRQEIDEGGIVGSLTRSGVGDYDVTITGITANAIITIGSTQWQARLDPANSTNNLRIITRDQSGTIVDADWVAIVIWRL